MEVMPRDAANLSPGARLASQQRAEPPIVLRLAVSDGLRWRRPPACQRASQRHVIAAPAHSRDTHDRLAGGCHPAGGGSFIHTQACVRRDGGAGYHTHANTPPAGITHRRGVQPLSPLLPLLAGGAGLLHLPPTHRPLPEAAPHHSHLSVPATRHQLMRRHQRPGGGGRARARRGPGGMRMRGGAGPAGGGRQARGAACRCRRPPSCPRHAGHAPRPPRRQAHLVWNPFLLAPPSTGSREPPWLQYRTTAWEGLGTAAATSAFGGGRCETGVGGEQAESQDMSEAGLVGR